VSSGDIDAILLHLFAISHQWPRNEGGFFKKPNHLYDIYNITTILELLEHKTSDKYIGIKVAVGLSLGGNDFELKSTERILLFSVIMCIRLL
jgi:hypothetical protein